MGFCKEPGDWVRVCAKGRSCVGPNVGIARALDCALNSRLAGIQKRTRDAKSVSSLLNWKVVGVLRTGPLRGSWKGLERILGLNTSVAGQKKAWGFFLKQGGRFFWEIEIGKTLGFVLAYIRRCSKVLKSE